MPGVEGIGCPMKNKFAWKKCREKLDNLQKKRGVRKRKQGLGKEQEKYCHCSNRTTIFVCS